MKLGNILGQRSRDQEDHWISISDLMAGLMIIFLFIAITYIRPIVETQNKIRDIVITWNASEVDIHKALKDEFTRDLKRWNAEIDRKTLSIRFKAPEVLFGSATSELKPKFKEILTDFFPRYIEVLYNFRHAIAEIRIEGHTSSEWIGAASTDEAYFENMALSQSRTRSVLEYSLGLEDVARRKSWPRDYITANGLSSSQVIIKNGQEDRTASRRVEFRVRTNIKEMIFRILETVK